MGGGSSYSASQDYTFSLSFCYPPLARLLSRMRASFVIFDTGWMVLPVVCSSSQGGAEESIPTTCTGVRGRGYSSGDPKVFP